MDYKKVEAVSFIEPTEEILLPCHKYKSRFSYMLLESRYHKTPVMFFIMALSFSFASIVLHLCSMPIACNFLIFFSCATFVIWIFCIIITNIAFNKFFYFNTRGKLAFLSAVIRYKPSADMATWNIICYDMNKYALENGITKSPNYFFDGFDCYEIFKCIYWVSSYNPKHIDNQIVANSNQLDSNNNEPFVFSSQPFSNMNTASNSRATLPTNPSHSLFPCEDIVEGVVMEKAKRKALRVFEESNDEYWAKLYPELDEQV